jgi:hypothetical protein
MPVMVTIGIPLPPVGSCVVRLCGRAVLRIELVVGQLP